LFIFIQIEANGKMAPINGSKFSLNITTTELSSAGKLYKRIFLAVATGITLGITPLNTGLTKAELISSQIQTQRVSNSPMLLAQSINRNEILATHNKYRQEVRVPTLKWSDSLAASAQQWANRLASTNTFQHSSSNYGENIWAGTKGAFSQTRMVESWGSEKQFFIPNRAFPNTCNGGWQKCGHYTQIIWKNTKEVGCGIASGAKMDYFVCQYNPPGNFQGQKPY
jgi:hypothetical protein